MFWPAGVEWLEKLRDASRFLPRKVPKFYFKIFVVCGGLVLLRRDSYTSKISPPLDVIPCLQLPKIFMTLHKYLFALALNCAKIIKPLALSIRV